MKATDFGKYGVLDFDQPEVELTGASLAEIQLRLMLSTQLFRTAIGRRVGLIRNGMTTGDHKAPWHPLGLAVDGHLYADDGPVELSDIVKAALTAGFKGIGVYWNGVQFSFHLDLRPDWDFWSGEKDRKAGGLMGAWKYGPLFISF